MKDDAPHQQAFRTGKAAEYLGCSVNYLNGLVKSGSLHPIDWFGERRFLKDDLDRLLKSRKKWRGKHERESEDPPRSS